MIDWDKELEKVQKEMENDPLVQACKRAIQAMEQFTHACRQFRQKHPDLFDIDGFFIEGGE